MPQIFDLHNDCLTSTKGKLSYARFIKSLQQQPVMQVVQAIFTTEYTEPVPQIQKLYQTFCQHANTQTKHIAIEDFWFATKRNVPTILQYNPLYIGLTWNDTNRLAGGAFGQGGLTPWGEQVVKQIEQTSLVDTAHLNEKSFYAFANITQKPILCSHTELASFYKHPRNLTNAQIQTIVQSNGLVGLCFVSEFINGKKHCTVQDIAQEIDYFVEHFGIEHIALGTDFYGTKKLPVGIKTYEDIFLLYTKLQKRGYTQKQMEQLFFQNAQNFFANVYKSYK